MSTANVGTTVTPKAEQKKPLLSVVGWVLYDLANTIFSLNIVSLYFSLWVVNVMGAGDADYGFANSISMAVIFFASPLLGALTDQAPRRMPFRSCCCMAGPIRFCATPKRCRCCAIFIALCRRFPATASRSDQRAQVGAPSGLRTPSPN